MDNLSVNVSNLTKKFGDFTAVDDVSFQISRGSIYGFLGPNGAGKSTTIRMLLGIIAPTGGSGTVLGLDILTQSDSIRANVGYMAQKFSLYEDLTVMENLDFFSGIFDLRGKVKSDRIDEILELAKLSGYENELTGDLPRGIRQRLSFGVSLINDPQIVFLDEPTGGVDPSLRRYFWDVIVDLSTRGKTVMVTTHYMDEVERCNEICLIYGGCVIARGSPEGLKRDYIAGDTYFCRTEKRLQLIEALKNLSGVFNPFPSGDTVRFILDKDSAGIDPIRNTLSSGGLGACKIEKTLPNLEDVFVYLVKEREK